MRGTTLILAAAGLVGLACGTTRLNAGSNGDAGTAGSKGLPYLGTPSNSFGLECEAPAPDWLAGAWQGEFDAYALPSGSKAVRIEFTGVKNTGFSPYGLCGTVTLGEGVPPPVATDPEASPPGANGSPNTPIVEGFAYEFVSQASFDAGVPASPGRVLFGIALNQIYKSWCNLQLSYDLYDPSTLDPSNPLPAESARCVPPSAITPGSWEGRFCNGASDAGSPASGFIVVGASCAQALYCTLDVCLCQPSWIPTSPIGPAQGCTVMFTQNTRFDLSLAGTILTGNAVFNQGIEGLHLTRVP